MFDLSPVHFIFYVFAAIAVVSALAVITTRNPVLSVLSLVVTFFATSGIWMILQAEFLSLILLLVYVGAVMTLFLFVVMMLNIRKEEKQSGFVRYFPFGILATLLLLGLMIYGYWQKQMPPTSLPESGDNLTQIGHLLYTDYAYPFEIAGVILLAAIIAAISLVHRPTRQRKSQDPNQQVSVRREDCVKLIKMPAEKN